MIRESKTILFAHRPRLIPFYSHKIYYVDRYRLTLATLLRRASKDERRKRKGRRKPCHITYQGWATSCLFSDSNYWLIPLILEREDFRSENFKSTFAIFFCILFKVNDVLCDRRMIKSQKTTGAMTPLLDGRGSFHFSLVCKITRISRVFFSHNTT